MANLSEIISLVDELAPKRIAYNWDNVGLQVGDYSQTIDKVLITLDITKEVIEEAIEKGCQLIISHHPLIFNPLNSIHNQTSTGQLIIKAIKNDIALFSAHTNLDLAKGGLNDYLAKILNLNHCQGLDLVREEKFYKLEEVVDESHLLLNNNQKFSLGRIGILEDEVRLGNYIQIIKTKLGLTTIKFVGSIEKMIQKVAVCCGNGTDLIQKAKNMGADLFITGDIKYHQARLAEELGLALVDAGHYETEIIVKKLMSKYLKDRVEQMDLRVEFIESEINTNPWNYA